MYDQNVEEALSKMPILDRVMFIERSRQIGEEDGKLLQKAKERWLYNKAKHIEKEMERVIKENGLEYQMKPFPKTF